MRDSRRAAIVAAILKKDLIQFSRDRIYMALSLFGLVMFIVVYWLLPDTVDESVTIGVSHHDLGQFEAMLADAEEGLEAVVFKSEETMRAVIAGDAEAWRTDAGRIVIRDTAAGEARPENAEKLSVFVGIGFPENFLQDTAAGTVSTVHVYVNDDTPAEIRTAMVSFIREIAFMLAGAELPVTEPDAEQIILGTDRMGAQISMRERMQPMLVFFVLMMETFALASLIAVEITHRTVTAITVTPARLSDVLIAKSVFGIGLAMAQAVVLLAAIGAFAAGNPLIILTAVLIGAAMFTGIGMAVGSSGRDFIGTLFYTMACILPLAIPAFSALFPGMSPAWVRFVPSHGIMQALIDATAYGAGWADVAAPLGTATLWLVVLFALGLGVLTKKVRTL